MKGKGYREEAHNYYRSKKVFSLIVLFTYISSFPIVVYNYFPKDRHLIQDGHFVVAIIVLCEAKKTALVSLIS